MVVATLPIEVIRRRERDDPIDNRRLRRALEDGSWVRITSGVFALGSDWAALTPIEQHRTRVLEVARRMRGPAVFSHFAAASIWGIDVFGRWPSLVDVLYRQSTGGRSGGAIRRHACDLRTVDTESFLGAHAVTTPAQTAVDLARSQPFVNAVAAVDQALWKGRRGGALTVTSELLGLIERAPDHPRFARAVRAVLFASPLAANVRESQSRVVIARLGFPTPRLQERRVLRSGRVVYGDFYFPDQDHWGEMDGRGKYLDAAMRAGRSTADVVVDEKNRENEIRREVRGFSHWEPAAADVPRRLYDILTGDGLRSALPRP